MSELFGLLEQVGPASAAATGVAAVLVLVCGLPWSGNRRALKSAGWVLGIGLGFFVGCWLLGFQLEALATASGEGAQPLLQWPPKQDRDRLLLVLLPAVIFVELLAAYVRPLLAWLPRLLLAGLAARILLHGSRYLEWSGDPQAAPEQAWLNLAVLGGVLALVWLLLSWLAHHSPSRALPISLALSCAAAGMTVMLSGYLTGGLPAFPLAAALLGAVVASLIVGVAGLPACVGVGVVSLFALVIVGRFFGELTTAHALMLFLAPLLCWLPALPGVRKLPALVRGTLAVALVMVPLGLTVTQARQKFIEDSMPRHIDTPTGTPIPEATADDYRNFGQ